jgi:hypothetical protein
LRIEDAHGTVAFRSHKARSACVSLKIRRLRREDFGRRQASPLAGVFNILFLQHKINETEYGLIYKILHLQVCKNPG